MNSLENRIIWIVGGGSGIGKAIALKASGEGARVWISGRRDGALKCVAQAASRCGNKITIAPCDATDPGQVKKTAGSIIKQAKRIDALVISIGWAISGSLTDTSYEDWKGLSNVHLDSMFLCSREALPGLKRSKNGDILIIGSIFGLRGKENRLAYCTMKGGVANFVRALALDLAGSVRVNSVCPGWVETEMSMSLVNSSKDPRKALRDRHGWHPMGRGGKPEEVADFCAFLLSNKSNWLTGQNIALDGGYTAR